MVGPSSSVTSSNRCGRFQSLWLVVSYIDSTEDNIEDASPKIFVGNRCVYLKIRIPKKLSLRKRLATENVSLLFLNKSGM